MHAALWSAGVFTREDHQHPSSTSVWSFRRIKREYWRLQIRCIWTTPTLTLCSRGLAAHTERALSLAKKTFERKGKDKFSLRPELHRSKFTLALHPSVQHWADGNSIQAGHVLLIQRAPKQTTTVIVDPLEQLSSPHTVNASSPPRAMNCH